MWHIRDQVPLPRQQRQADMMVIVRLASEFQGFARDLHDQAVEFLVTSAATGNPTLDNVITIAMTADRALSKNNAGDDTLAKDFRRIGLNLWPTINTQNPQQGPILRTKLQKLIAMRNAIAHDNEAQIITLESEGFTLQRTVTRDWQTSLDTLATIMDDVVGSFLGALMGAPRPW
jgi:hypothetical protein